MPWTAKTEPLKMAQLLSSLSWQEIYALYKSLGDELAEYDGMRQRLGMDAVTVHIDRSDVENTFILRFWREVSEINKKLLWLDIEIRRRNNLIGVI